MICYKISEIDRPIQRLFMLETSAEDFKEMVGEELMEEPKKKIYRNKQLQATNQRKNNRSTKQRYGKKHQLMSTMRQRKLQEVVG